MRSYELMIMELLKGNNPKDKYEYLLELINSSAAVTEKPDSIISHIPDIEELENPF